MNIVWFLLGYGLAAYWAHRETLEDGLVRIENHANYEYDQEV